jgi:hypothetical protein
MERDLGRVQVSRIVHDLILSRVINENLYKTDSRQAHQMMKDDPRIFEDVGYILLCHS